MATGQSDRKQYVVFFVKKKHINLSFIPSNSCVSGILNMLHSHSSSSEAGAEVQQLKRQTTSSPFSHSQKKKKGGVMSLRVRKLASLE